MKADSSDKNNAIAVIGAGIVGISCALHLLWDGHDVTLIDAQEPGKATSFGNAGILSYSSAMPTATPGLIKKLPAMLLDQRGPLHFRPSSLPWLWPWLLQFVVASRTKKANDLSKHIRSLISSAKQAHDAVIQRCGAGDLWQQSGWIKLARSKAFFDRALVYERSRLDHFGIRYEILDGPALREMEPSLSDEIACGLHLLENERILDPLAYSERLFNEFSRNGGHFYKARVVGLDLMQGCKVLTQNQRLPFSKIVVAAGAFSKKLAIEAGHRVPLETERGYHVMLKQPGEPLKHSVLLMEHGMVLSPMNKGLRLTSGVEIARTHASPDYTWVKRLARQACTYLRDLNPEPDSVWMGHRPSMPDSLPVIGASERHPDVYFAFGHQHVGLTLGPVTGRLIADLIAGRPPAINLEPFRPARRYW